MIKIDTNEILRYIYSRGGSVFSQTPSGVAIPKNIDQLIQLIKYLIDNNISFLIRGSGTSRSGQDIGRGVIVDLSINFNKILKFDQKSGILVVEPGVIGENINIFLKKYNRFFPPDPSSLKYCTIGGMCGNNSGGPLALKWGVMRDYVEKLEIICSDGNRYLLPDQQNDPFFNKLISFLKNSKDKIENFYPKSIKNSSGYNLKDIFTKNGINITPLFVGSEGTLGVITKLYLKTEKISSFEKKLISGFFNLDQVVKFVNYILKFKPEKLELVDRDIIKLAGKTEEELPFLKNIETRYIVLISFSSNNQLNLNYYIKEILENYKEDIYIPKNDQEMEQIFSLRSTAAGYIYKNRESKKPIPIIEDLIVKTENFQQFIKSVKEILSIYNTKAYFFGHIGDGNIHINTFLDLRDKDDVLKAKNIRERVHKSVIDMGGILSGEHGDGKLRSKYLKELYPELYPIFKKIKEILDPNHLFNPDTIILKDNIDPFNSLKIAPSIEDIDDIFTEKDIAESLSCSGCGKCKTFCPVFLATNKEEYSTRGRVNIVQGVIQGDIKVENLKDNPFRDILDSCIHCNRCLKYCPSAVNGGDLVRVLLKTIPKKQSPIEKIIKNNQFVGQAGQLFNPLTNILIKNSIIKAIGGLPADIELPKFGKKQVLSDHLFNKEQLNSDTILYFTGCFEKYYNTNEYKATISILNWLKVDYMVPNFACCNVSGYVIGDEKRENLEHNQYFFHLARKYNSKVIFTAPSCLYSVKKQGDFDVSIDFFVWLLDKLGDKQRFFNSGTIQWHSPCHSEEIQTNATIKILEIFGYKVIKLPENCCGMGGSFGMFKKNRDLSKKMGKKQFEIVENNKNIPLTTTCGTCNIQFSNETSAKIIHPVEMIYKVLKNSNKI